MLWLINTNTIAQIKSKIFLIIISVDMQYGLHHLLPERISASIYYNIQTNPSNPQIGEIEKIIYPTIVKSDAASSISCKVTCIRWLVCM